MKSYTNPTFRKLFATLPAEVREQARTAYRLFKVNPRHPGLNFKRIHGKESFVSAVSAEVTEWLAFLRVATK